MFCLWLTQRKVAKYLSEPIRKWGWDPFISEEDKALAKSALKETLRRAKAILPRTRHVFIGEHDYPLHDADRNYLKLLLIVKRALEHKRWNDACNELTDVINLYHVEDRRILNEIIGLLEGRLD